MQFAEFRPGHRDHPGGGVELFVVQEPRGSWRSSGPDLRFETVDVAQHLGLGVVLHEHLVGQHGVGAQQVLRNGVMSLGGLVEGLHIEAVTRPKNRSNSSATSPGGGLERDTPDRTVQIRTQVDAEPFGLGSNECSLVRRQDCEGIEPAVVLEGHALWR